MADVIELSITLAPCEFNHSAALLAHENDPKILDPLILASDHDIAQRFGLSSLLTSAYDKISAHTLQQSVIETSFRDVATYTQLKILAATGVSTIIHPTFTPNNGINCPSYPTSIADPKILVDLLYDSHRLGRFVILPLQLVKDLAKSEKLTLHCSPLFLAKKRDKPRGRLVVNYSHDGPNHIAKKSLLAQVFGRITTPQIANICQLVINAHKVFPGQELVGLRRDIDNAYHRMRYSLPSSMLCATQISIGPTTYAIIPTVALMGDQDVNSSFDQVTKAINEKLSLYTEAITKSRLSLTTTATDDIIGIGSKQFISDLSDQIGRIVGDGRAPGLCSHSSAISQHKDLYGSTIEILGWLFDIPNQTISPTALTFAKLINLFFVETADSSQPGQRISVLLLMRLGAHATRSADVITPMLPYSRSFHQNTRGSCNPTTSVYLTKRSSHDITMWQALLTYAFNNAEILFAKTYAPTLRHRLFPTETNTERDHRGFLHANHVLYSDACTGDHTKNNPPGVGGYLPNYAWFGTSVPALQFMRHSSGDLVPTSINILELLGLIFTLAVAVAALPTTPNTHIHIFCDNTTCVSKVRTLRATHPVYSYLLFAYSFLQIRSQVTVTIGSIPGADNITADAASRRFQVPNGPNIRQSLVNLQQYNISPTFIDEIHLALMTSPNTESLPPVGLPIKLVSPIS